MAVKIIMYNISMEGGQESNQLLKNKYNLHKSQEVETAVKRRYQRTGERVPQDPLVRIQNYLNRFHEIIERGGLARREHNLDLIKSRFHAEYVVKPDEIPESFWETQRRIIRDRGQAGDLDQVDFEELKRQNTEAIIADQKSSLDKWIDYLSSPDAPYSDALKYWTLRNVLSMAEYDKEKKAYPQRSKGTTKPFPDLNREALAYVLDAIEKKYSRTPVDRGEQTEDQKEFAGLLKTENFPKLYAWAIEKVTPASAEELSATRGEWIKYNQGSGHMSLVRSLQGHGTGWCTAGESTAEVQLKGGDFYVYYSLDREGKPTVPRAAIRMEGNRIAEVRGIAAEQNLDFQVTPIVEEKLKEFPDGPSYQERVSDMKHLTEIGHKIEYRQNLSSEDLKFLYEIDSSIEGFGYSRDPRIQEIRSGRSPEVDMLIIFNCEPEQIAHKPSEINTNTRAYVGILEKGIFQTLQRFNIEHVYTTFPEEKIRFFDVQAGGETPDEILRTLETSSINVSDYTGDMIRSEDFLTLSTRKSISTVRLKVSDLGFPQGSTTEEIYKRAQELGLELCPPEVGPALRLKDLNQRPDDWYLVAMEQIADSRGSPNVFSLGRDEAGLWLYDRWAVPDDRWDSEDGFVFGLRK